MRLETLALGACDGGEAAVVTRIGTYYAFWLPVALVVIVLEVLWRVTLLETLERRR